MNEDKDVPSYSKALIALLNFVKDVAKDPRTPEDVTERAAKVAGDFLIAALFSLVDKKPKCERCGGKGYIQLSTWETETCPDCGGK